MGKVGGASGAHPSVMEASDTVRNENSLIPHRGDLSPHLLTFQRRREEAAFANLSEETCGSA